MSVPRWLALAREGRLYPSVILHGGSEAERRATAIEIARTLLCDEESGARPCGTCRHCRRITWPDGEVKSFHPDVALLERDLKTSTSAEATRGMLRAAQLSPYEARGQVFVIADAGSLSAEASDALLKAIEEPYLSAPRHFLLLAASRLDLSATLRSRSLALFLGPAEAPDAEATEATARELAAAIARHLDAGGGLWLLETAAILGRLGGFEDPRSERPWTEAAAAVRATVTMEDWPADVRRSLLALAEELLTASAWRLRGVPPERLLEGVVAGHLASLGGQAAG